MVIRNTVTRGQLRTLCPAGGEVASCITGKNICRPAVASIVVVKIRPNDNRVAVDRHTPAEPVSRRGVGRGQLRTLCPAGSEVASCITGKNICRPAAGSMVVVIPCPDHHRVAVNRHAFAEVVILSAVVRGQLRTLCPSGSEIAGGVAREHVRRPSTVFVPIHPDHRRVAVDRYAEAEQVIHSAVARGQLGNLRPAGGDVAGCVAREHIRRPAAGSVVVVKIRPNDNRVAVDRYAAAELVIRSGVTRGQLSTLKPIFIEHVCRPLVDSIVVVKIRPNHHRVAVDRHADAEQVTCRAVARGQL